MRVEPWTRPRRLTAIALVAAMGFAGLYLTGDDGEKSVTVEFSEAKGLYVGDDVVVLGVAIGKVSSIEPGPDTVSVKLTYDSQYDIPADAKAILESPNLVTVRQVSLAPAYDGGAVLADGATIPVSRTDVPVEWDDIKEQVNALTVALGPQGVNSKGALNRLLKVSSGNLRGQGTSINQTVTALSEAMATIADNKGELFGTVRNLEVIVRALALSNQQISEFNSSLAVVADVLSNNRREMTVALKGIRRAFADLDAFLKDNRDTLKKTVADVEPTTSMLAENRQRVADILHLAPHELSNLIGIYDPVTGSVGASIALTNLQSPGQFICSAIYSLGGAPEDCQQAISPLAQLLTTNPPPVGISPIENYGNTAPAPGGKGSRASSNGTSSARPPSGQQSPSNHFSTRSSADQDLLSILLGGAS